MAEATQEVIDIVEAINVDEDIKQDFYVRWLASPEPNGIFDTREHLENFINNALSWMLKNSTRDEDNRRRLLLDNEDTVRAWADNGQSPDPLDVMLAEELRDELIGNLSDIERDIYSRILGEGQTYKEVANDLDMSVHAVEQHVYRIKKRSNGTNKDNNQ